MLQNSSNRMENNGMNVPRRFWVIGGEYVDMSFAQLVEGTHRLIGPFQGNEDAYRAWRALAFATSAQATVRFFIVEEASLWSANAVAQR